ncbi:Serine/threonine-protein kinase pakE [Operophtera brumata]|uniref:Serine/threonine-protein kinase pakE n=1 Tax=Operophtera brumata TaxID=104452 RepID=A0A0L7L643_OPEBR|nr:Serine/threonine-protein kinase pakE [Operophtera brumata]
MTSKLKLRVIKVSPTKLEELSGDRLIEFAKDTRPSIQAIVEVSSNPSSISPSHSLYPSLQCPANSSANKYMTYNKYTNPLGAISPMLRLKTFNVDTSTDNSAAVKEGLTNMMNERSSLNMYQSGESLMRMSPPSLVSSLMMECSGNFNPESLEGRRSMPSHRDSGLPTSGRDSIDPMMTSMTLSILDEKDMSTSFLSQTTYPDNDSLIDSLPPSLVSSVNSSYVINSSKLKDDSNIFSSTTFTHLEQSEKLLSFRPRCQLYNSFKRESGIKTSESYTKSREEACQIDTIKVLSANANKKEPQPKVDMAETITLHFANNKFRNTPEKENFERDDTFYKEMGLPQPDDLARNSLNVTLGKQELNEIIQARQKLSLARKGLPSEPDKPLPNQVDASAIKTIQLPNQTITVPKHSMENASELLSRRRALNGFERDEPPTRESPKRNATFKKLSPRASSTDTTVDWGSQERAMVGSSESTDTGTFSSSSPPDSVPDAAPPREPRTKNHLLNLHTAISPIYDLIDDKSYTVAAAGGGRSPLEATYDMHNTTVINSATAAKKSNAKRDILAAKGSPERRIPPSSQMRCPSSTRIPPTNTSYVLRHDGATIGHASENELTYLQTKAVQFA